MEITDEQKLYVLLDCLYSKNPVEQDIWKIVSKRVSKDDALYRTVADRLTSNGYLEHGIACSGGIPRDVWSTTDLGKIQIPILWKSSRIRKEYEKDMKTFKEESSFKVRHNRIYKVLKFINDYFQVIIGAIISAIVTWLLMRCMQ